MSDLKTNAVQANNARPVSKVEEARAEIKKAGYNKNDQKVKLEVNGNIFTCPAKDLDKVDKYGTLKLKNGVSIDPGFTTGAKIDINTDGKNDVKASQDTVIDIEGGVPRNGYERALIAINSENNETDHVKVIAKDSEVLVNKDKGDYIAVTSDNSNVHISSN